MSERRSSSAKKIAAQPRAAAHRGTSNILQPPTQGRKLGPVSKADADAKPVAKPTADPTAKPAARVPKPARPVYLPMPSRRDYLKPRPRRQPTSTKGKRSRRSFFELLFGSALATGFTLLATTIGLWMLSVARFMFPNVVREPPSRFKVGSPDDVPPGDVETKFKASHGIWVVNTEYAGTA